VAELDGLLDALLDRVAVELADRVERRLDRLAAERPDGPKALDVKQAAVRLGVSPTTMHELVISGQVPSVKVGRRRLIAASTIDRMLNGASSGQLPATLGHLPARANHRRITPS